MRKIKFELNFKLPSFNEILNWAKIHKGKWNKYYEEKKRIERDIVVCIPKVMMENPVEIKITFFESTRRRDPDNIFASAKFILDAMKGKVIPDDTQKYIKKLSYDFIYGKEQKVVVEVEQIFSAVEAKRIEQFEKLLASFQKLKKERLFYKVLKRFDIESFYRQGDLDRYRGVYKYLETLRDVLEMESDIKTKEGLKKLKRTKKIYCIDRLEYILYSIGDLKSYKNDVQNIHAEDYYLRSMEV